MLNFLFSMKILSSCLVTVLKEIYVFLLMNLLQCDLLIRRYDELIWIIHGAQPSTVLDWMTWVRIVVDAT
ncbi:hypothetical protein CUMW_176430 [Citrus unshiu]|uniref:Uncharacterized protein n=1 Tax=Citrus unshiu TaxID=55188 RepID=A0A2H5PXG6_CITUN|nr:hypothetical protein CUMW_176430 [Citrus unshiu]